jgi:hypothetical protein
MSNSTTQITYINPSVANGMNACLVALFSFGLMMTPQKFMQGGLYQHPWFQNIPEDRNNRLYFLAQFIGLIMLGGAVVPTLLSPNEILLTYQFSIIQGVNLIHTILFLSSSLYTDRPTMKKSLQQWWGMTGLSTIFFIITIVAAVGPKTSTEIKTKETILSKETANIVLLVFSSFFGLLFTFIPRIALSMFWEDDYPADNKIGPFHMLKTTSIEHWWCRNAGTALLGLNAGMAVYGDISHPLYAYQSLTIVSTLTLLNLHQITMGTYKKVSNFQVKASWIPTLISSSAMIAVLVLSFV